MVSDCLTRCEARAVFTSRTDLRLGLAVVRPDCIQLGISCLTELPRLRRPITMIQWRNAFTRSEVLQQRHVGTLRVSPNGKASAIRRRYSSPELEVEPLEHHGGAAGKVDIQQG
jgi:hypothetical protein